MKLINVGYHYYRNSLSDIFLGVEKKILKEMPQFYIFYPIIISSKDGRHKVYKFLFPYSTDATYLWLD